MSDHLISMVVNIPMAVNFLFKINEAKSFRTLIEMHHRHTFVNGQVDLHFSRNIFNVERSDNFYCLRSLGSQVATENFLNFAKLTCFISSFQVSVLCSTIKMINTKVRKI